MMLLIDYLPWIQLKTQLSQKLSPLVINTKEIRAIIENYAQIIAGDSWQGFLKLIVTDGDC